VTVSFIIRFDDFWMARKIFFTPQNISAVLVVGLCFGVNWGTQKAVGIGGNEVAEEATDYRPIKTASTPPVALNSAATSEPPPALSLIADDELGASIQVRATYLLGVGRDSGNAKHWLDDYQNSVQWELNHFREEIGTFDGDATHFATKVNWESELAATELALHWIANPSDRNELPNIPVNRPIDFYSIADGPTQGVIPDDE